MFYVYILRLSDGTFYKGQTKNIEKRLEEHSNKEVKSTKNRIPFNLIHVDICNTRAESRTLEIYFKSGYGREIIQEIAEVVER